MPGPSHTINEWCALRKVSRAMFYKVDERGGGGRIVMTAPRERLPNRRPSTRFRSNTTARPISSP
jgi:hypothetical protein